MCLKKCQKLQNKDNLGVLLDELSVGKLVLADIGCLFISFMAYPDDCLLPPNSQCHVLCECRSFPPLSSWFAHFPLFFAACPPSPHIHPLMCDDHNSYPLRLYVQKIMQTQTIILWVGDHALGSSPIPEYEQWWWYYSIYVLLTPNDYCTSTACTIKPTIIVSRSFSSCCEQQHARGRGRGCSKQASRHSASWRDTSKLLI